MTSKTFLIVGASRGIGQEFVNQLFTREDTIVYAAVRNPTAKPSSIANGHDEHPSKSSAPSEIAVEGPTADGPPVKNNSANDETFSTKLKDASITNDTAAANGSPSQKNKILTMKLDVTSNTSVAAAAASIEDSSIDVLIINAGICHFGALKDQGPESMREIMETNICGPMRIIDAFKGKMTGAKKIVVLSSRLGSIGMCWGHTCGKYSSIYL